MSHDTTMSHDTKMSCHSNVLTGQWHGINGTLVPDKRNKTRYIKKIKRIDKKNRMDMMDRIERIWKIGYDDRIGKI